MSGAFSAGGLISGLDSNSIIRQLMQIEREPILRLRSRIDRLNSQQETLRELRTQLTTLRNRGQDFRFNSVFNKFQTASSEESVLGAQITGSNPAVGAFEVNVIQLASATVAQGSDKLGAAINPGVALNSSGINGEVEGGTFTINGVAFTVDPDAQSLDDVLNQINSSGAGLVATYDPATDKVTFENAAPGDDSLINFGASGDDSNLLDILRVTQATQTTGGGGATVVTSTRNLGAVDSLAELNTVAFANGAVTAGSFSINGVSIAVDPTQDSLQDIIERINSSDAQVNASYDATTDSIRVVSKTLGSRTIKFGGAGDTSNFLAVTNLAAANQTAGKDAQFTINGGGVQTRNTNDVSDAITGVTLTLKNTGASSITVSRDTDSVIEGVREFLDEFNASVEKLRGLTRPEGALRGDAGIRNIENSLRSIIFNQVFGLGGFTSLAEIGITTGEDFDSAAGGVLKLNEDRFREALQENSLNVQQLFSNSGQNGVVDQLFAFLDEATKATGFLNDRAKPNGIIDQQVRSLNEQIDRIEDRLVQREDRLRRQFTRLEQLSAGFQNQSAALSRLGAGMRLF